MSNAGWCCSYEDGNGLWYTDEYPEEVFFDHWFWMAERYRHNPLVIGADLRNEIRGILGSTKKFTARAPTFFRETNIFFLCSNNSSCAT